MSAEHDLGFQPSNGTRIVHGEGSITKNSFPAETNIPGQLQIFHLGHSKDISMPTMNGTFGCLPFDVNTRMPRHVHMTVAEDAKSRRYVVENILVLNGVAIVELGGEIYVIPPKTLVSIGSGVPHTWTACPSGLDLQKLGLSPDDQIVSDGQFLAVFQYEEPTVFLPTKQTKRLMDGKDYESCDDLHSIRIPKYEIDDLITNAWFVWGKRARKACDIGS
ncbi:hypothetical protein EAE96_003739 [Botrytis aclada]|nr:hypothetical protein EAE96_003739 [Botrytis aclada]